MPPLPLPIAPAGEGPVVCAYNAPAKQRKLADYQCPQADAGPTINDAIDEAGQSRTTKLLPGKYVFTTPIIPVQDCILEGSGRGGLSIDTTTSTWLSFQGGATENAIDFDGASELSRLELARFRLTDDRGTKTSGSTIRLKRVKNRVCIREALIGGAPDDGIYVGADSGQSSDCVQIEDVWVGAGRYGINVERLDNATIIRGVKCDSIQANGDTLQAAVRVASIGAVPASGVIHISDVKHECTNGANTILIPDSATSGALLLESIIMRSSIVSGGGFVLRVSAGDGTGIVAVNLAHDGTAAGVIRNVANDYTVTTNPLAFWAGGGRGIGLNDWRLYGLTGGGTNPLTAILKGHVQTETDDTYDLGLVSKRFRNIRAASKVYAEDGIGVGNSAAATTPGTVVKKMEIFDASGNSLGYVPIYDTIS